LLFVLVLILADVLRVRHVLAAHPVMDVAMVSSSHIGRGYHSALMIDNQTHKGEHLSSKDAIVANQSIAELSLTSLGICLMGNQTKRPS
jgi:hypothetical protein